MGPSRPPLSSGISWGGSAKMNDSVSTTPKLPSAIPFHLPLSPACGAISLTARSLGRSSQGLVEVVLDVLIVLYADGEADVVLGHPGRLLLLRGKLLVRRGGRMDHEALRVADVREVREELHRVDELLPRRCSALDPKADYPAVLALQVLLRQLVAGVVFEPRVVHPAHRGVGLQELCDLERVLRVPLLPQGERLDSLEQEERVERAHARPQVAEELDPGLDDERDVPES